MVLVRDPLPFLRGRRRMHLTLHLPVQETPTPYVWSW